MDMVSTPRLNGIPSPRKQAGNKPKTGRKQPARRQVSKMARRVALVLGGVGVGVLGLSVHHCTGAISLLTGSHWALAGLLAIGIDAGMGSAELAELVLQGSKDHISLNDGRILTPTDLLSCWAEDTNSYESPRTAINVPERGHH